MRCSQGCQSATLLRKGNRFFVEKIRLVHSLASD
jgi:hypothetical protein